VTDDPELWSVVRRTAGDDPQVLALCGASRIQLGFSTEEARRVEPGVRVVQLAIDGTNAVSSYRDLAEDDSFRGTVLFSLLPGALSPDVWDDQTPWVKRRAQGFSFDAAANRAWRADLQERWSILAPEAELRRAARRLLERGDLPEQMMVLRADRSRTADYSGLDLAEYAVWRLERDRRGLEAAPRGPDYERWLAAVDAVEAMTRRIQARGGRAVFFHDLVTGEYARVYRTAFPAERYWDVVKKRSSALCISADEIPEIARLVCPDGSHIDQTDSPVFTRALLAELRRRGALQ
jgi:hypothetical protein